MMHDAPQPLIGHLHDTGCRQDRHLPHQRHGGLLEKQGELAALACPWNFNAFHSVLRTVGAGHGGSDVAVMLEEVEMAPRHLLKVVGLTRFPADRAGEFGASWHLEGNTELMRHLALVERLPLFATGMPVRDLMR